MRTVPVRAAPTFAEAGTPVNSSTVAQFDSATTVIVAVPDFVCPSNVTCAVMVPVPASEPVKTVFTVVTFVNVPSEAGGAGPRALGGLDAEGGEADRGVRRVEREGGVHLRSPDTDCGGGRNDLDPAEDPRRRSARGHEHGGNPGCRKHDHHRHDEHEASPQGLRVPLPNLIPSLRDYCAVGFPERYK